MVAQNIGSAERRGRGWRSPLAVAATAAIALTGCSVTPKAGAQTEGGAPALGDVADAPVLDGIVNNRIRYGDNLCDDPRLAGYVAKIIPELASAKCVFSPPEAPGSALYKKGGISFTANLDKTGEKAIARAEEDLNDNPYAETTRLDNSSGAQVWCTTIHPGVISIIDILRPDNTSISISASNSEGVEEPNWKPIDYFGCTGPDGYNDGNHEGEANLTPDTKALVNYLAEATKP